LIASIDSPKCHFGICHMTYTWRQASGRDPEDWNPTPGMTQAALDRTIFAPDGYTKVLDSSGSSWQTMQSEFDDCFASARSWGFARFAISEHALNNDAGASPAAVASIWENDYLPWIDSQDLAYYAYWSSEGYPAAGANARIDTPEEWAV